MKQSLLLASVFGVLTGCLVPSFDNLRGNGPSATADGDDDGDDGGAGDAGPRESGVITEPDAAALDAGVDATTSEVCNGKDDDKDGQIDEDGCLVGAVTLTPAQREGRAYLFVEEPRTWPQASTLCASLGYRLVRIESEGENAFISARPLGPGAPALGVPDRWWIGLNDREIESNNDPKKFVWEDKQALGFAGNFKSGEPNGGQDQDCVLLDPSEGGRWFDDDCDLPKRFVCKSL